MTEHTRLSRRNVLRATAVSIPAVLAGCSATSGSSPPTASSDESGGDGSNDGNSTGGSGGDSGGATPSFGGWMDDVSNYDGVVDNTGQDSVTIDVGAAGNNGQYAFAPAAVAVSPGTTVVWKWTGQGGSHNVVQDGGFESEMVSEKGHTFEQTFDSAATIKYYCLPHKAMGMKGVVVVE